MVRVSLRRFTFDEYVGEPGRAGVNGFHEACPAQPLSDEGYQSGHSASVVVLEYAPMHRDPIDSEGRQGVWPTGEWRDDQWPTVCAGCGAACADGWERQANQDEYLRDADGNQWPQSELPIGALWDAPWLHGTTWIGEDGISLHVMLPPGRASDTWSPDCPSTNGRPWSRTGDPRQPDTLNVEPSILTPYWHGHLRPGQLVEC